MTEDTIRQLNKQGEPGGFYEVLLSHVRALTRMSRMHMSRYYRQWDTQHLVYRGLHCLDEDDREQQRKGKPTKMIVPNTFAQCQSFTSFLFLLFNQNRTFYELSPNGAYNFQSKRMDCERILERDLRKSQWNTVLYQHLTDLARFGPSILELTWEREVTTAYVTPQPYMVSYGGVSTEVRPGSEWAEFVKYEGNIVRNVSPYRFLPDTRFPLVDFQRGEFCASEEEYSMNQLRDMEEAGEVAGIDKIRPFGRNWQDARGGETRAMMDIQTGKFTNWLAGPSKSEGTALVTKCQVKIVPFKFKLGGEDDKPIGPEEHQVLYNIWYANDNCLIKVEPAYTWHNRFSYAVAQFTPDMHETVSLGLADLVYRLQDVISWLINSRIKDVRRNLQGRNVIDPFGIETKSLDGEGDIYLRKGASKSGVDRWIKQLAVTDVTQSHMTDADLLNKMMQLITGVNDNAMGQYNSGRRSAQEARVVTSGAAGRMKMHGQLIWESSLGPLGQMMLTNERQSMDYDSFARIIGQLPDDPAQMDPQTGMPVPGKSGDQKLQDRYNAFRGTPEDVICTDEYMVFDSTLQSEKGFQAQQLMELLQVCLAQPQAAQMFDINPKALLEEIQELRTGTNNDRFSFEKAQGQPKFGLPNGATGVPAQPPAMGQMLTPQAVTQFLQMANGNPQLARQLARQSGFIF